MEDLMGKLRHFAKEREWERFHSPKNLAMALSVEVAELLETFQWLTEEESRNLTPEKLAEVKDEIGDVMIYLLNIADKLGVDALDAAREKLLKNIEKYPAETVKGRAVKYTQLDGNGGAGSKGGK